MKKKELSIKQKNADKDLNIIVLFTLIPLIIYLVFGNSIMNFAKISQLNIWLRFIPIILIQFGLAGLGSLIVILYRKEKLKEYGLVKNNLFKTIMLTIIVCFPSLVFLLVNNEVKSYFPLKGCFFTKINDRYINKNKWLNYGAIVCGIICILIHGMIGFDLYTIFEALTTFILIYGMLVVKENTNNAWGCILIFLLYWNAI